jgi:hypothetical protein
LPSRIKKQKSKNGKQYKRSLDSTYFRHVDQLDHVQRMYEEGESLSVIKLTYNYYVANVIKGYAKRNNWSRKEKILPKDELAALVLKIKNNKSQGFGASLKCDDVVTRSINHYDSSDHRLVQKAYNICYPNSIKKCLSCEVDLKFSTFDTGYGAYNGKKICGKCINSKFTSRTRCSKASLDLFDEIYCLLNDSERAGCRYASLNSEKTISTINHQDFHPLINKRVYYLDFVIGNKNIEYDSERWHNREKDSVRDEFLATKNIQVHRVDHDECKKNRNKVLKECLNFILT